MRPRSLPGIIVLVVAAAVIGAACGATIDLAVPDPAEPPLVTPTDTAEPTPKPVPTPTPEPDPAGRAALPDDLVLELGPRIAVQTGDGQIFTMLGDGSNQVPLTDPAEGRLNTGPVWSRDANRLAWVASDAANDAVAVRTARFDGTAWGQVEVRDRPLLMAWDPSSTQVAALTPDGPVLELGVIDVDRELGYRAIDEGAPFWFSWNPDADGFLVHASTVRLDFVPLEGPSQVLEQAPGLFQAPRWLDGPVQLIYADEVGDEQFLVVAGAEGSGRRALVTYDGYLQFSVSPSSELVALHVIDPSLAPVPDVITASFAQDEELADIIDPIPRNELTIMALFGGDPFIVYPPPGDFQPRPVLSFHWSPDGSRLAWLLEADPGDGDCQSETALYEWQFWTGDSFVEGPRFHPTATFACDYVPLFDQLEQSLTFWSPDATVFTYAGTDPSTGQRGIWNYDIGAFLEPTLVAQGEIGVWSPSPAGSAAQSAL